MIAKLHFPMLFEKLTIKERIGGQMFQTAVIISQSSSKTSYVNAWHWGSAWVLGENISDITLHILRFVFTLHTLLIKI